MTKIYQIIQHLEQVAPPVYQESYDNSGLITGNSSDEVTGVLISLDATESIVDEAIEKKCNLIISHHPIVFKGLKSLTGKNYVERTVLKAIRNNISLYAIHTNLDNVRHGVNNRIADQLGLIDRSVLAPKKGILQYLVTYVPLDHTTKVLASLHNAGAGRIGLYENCSFTSPGTGAFKPLTGSNPHIGRSGEIEKVNEERIEVVVPIHRTGAVLEALFESHPYESVAYYLNTVENVNQEVGSGMIGFLDEPLPAEDFLKYLKKKMQLNCIRHTALVRPMVRKVALCGGSGSFLLNAAIQKQADVYISADFKYHEFFDAEDKIIIMDIGHYESEVFTKDLIYELINKKFTNIAVDFTEKVTNPISYF